ncbi:MAG: hypothetical protein EA415_11035 [Sphaerobacteraceae bacterium]|nr:MAG: hypothetical protein EA415_11035 [Sphaerobacteraceae bacterium]
MLAVAVVALYGTYVRSWMRNWGATEAEVRAELPGEWVSPSPQYQARRGITINAPAEVVWRWLIQIGQGRGGFYSYDWLENLFSLEIHSTDRIVPEFQALALGDFIAAEPNHVAGWRVTEIDTGKSLVLTVSIEESASPDAPQLDPDAFSGIWIFQLNPIDTSSCRLIADFRADFESGPLPAALLALLLEPVHFIMERKMLHGIRERAERSASDHPGEPIQVRHMTGQ